MIKYRFLIYIFLTIFLPGFSLAAPVEGDDEISTKVYNTLIQTIDINRKNDRQGLSYKNNYIIEVNLDDSWLEERGSGNTVLQSKRSSISETLNKFNASRPDKLRVYVVVVNDWSLRMKQQVIIESLPKTVNFEAMSKQAEADQAEEILRVKDDLNAVPKSIRYKLEKQGYTDVAVYFGAMIKFYNTVNNETQQRKYKYTNVFLTSKKLLDVKEKLRSKMVHFPDLSLEDDLELGVISLTDGITEVFDNRPPLVLAYKTSNSNINNWYGSLGEKNTVPYSSTTTDKQVYDYTGVFSSLQDKIISYLPDPTAKIIFTDNLTSDNIIENIKALLAKPSPVNVFWFHLDRKGVLQTEVVLAEDVRERFARDGGVSLSNDMLQFIEQLYAESGPKIRSAADLIDFLNVEAHLFKSLSYVLDGIKIPKSWWDASDKDYLLGTFGQFISPQTGQTWAFVCGLWNGVIENLSMVSGLGQMVTGLKGMFYKIIVDSDYRDELFGDLKFYYDNLSTLISFGYETIKQSVVKEFEDQLAKLKAGDLTGVAYLGGMIVVEIVINIFTAGIAAEVKAGLMSIKLIRVPVEFLAKAGRVLMKPIAIILKKGLSFVTEGALYVVKTSTDAAANILFKINLATKEILLTSLQSLEGATDVVALSLDGFILRMDGNVVEGALALGRKDGKNILGRLAEDVAESIDIDKAVLDLQKNSIWKKINLQVLKDYLENKNSTPGKSLRLLDELAELIKDFSDNQKEALLKDLTTPGGLFGAIVENPKFVIGWKKLDDAGLSVLRKDLIQLKKFDDLVNSNNLGLDADGLGDLLKAPKSKGLAWDNPDKVLDAVKRSSDVNIKGLSIGHKKFPAPANGTDNFVLKNAKQYQAEASGDAALSFNKGNVSFDDIAPDGKLVDRKYGHGSSIFDKVDDGFETVYEVVNKNRAQSLIDQAKRQLDAVGGDGSKLRWEISTQDGANGIRDLFKSSGASDQVSGINQIEVIYKAQKTIIP